MNKPRCQFVLVASLLVAGFCGCKSDPKMDAWLDSVNAEKLNLQNVIYDLKYENEKLRKKLDAATTSATSAAADDPGDDYGPFVQPPDSGEGDPGDLTPMITPPGPTIDAPANPDLSVPKTSPGVEADPREVFPNQTLGRRRESSNSAGVLRELPNNIGPPTQPVSPELADAEAIVTHLHINRVATRGRNTDGRDGDDVLMIGLEPRDQYGRFVPAASAVSIVVLDPKQQGQEARVAEWHFDANQVAIGAQHAGATPMILLEAAWPKRPPKHTRLQLWARYTTTDGRILQTQETIHVTVAGQFSTRWTPRNNAAQVADGDPAEWSPNR